MIGLVLLSVCVVGLVMLAMGVGAMISGRCLRGSCGGLRDPNRDLACDTCPLRKPDEGSRPAEHVTSTRSPGRSSPARPGH